MKVRREPDHLSHYNQAHTLLRKARGRAGNYPCADCGGRAQQWSYTHGCPSERTNSRGVLPYCTHIEHYEVRCMACHRQFDKKVA